MSIDVVGNEKLVYYEGQEVLFNIDGTIMGTGVIRGRGAEGGIVDMWIVEVKTASGFPHADYPWSCVFMSHHHIRPAPDVVRT